jgi:hypothetical protein
MPDFLAAHAGPEWARDGETEHSGCSAVIALLFESVPLFDDAAENLLDRGTALPGDAV